MSKFLIVGLGNIGAEYAKTRHNIGFDVADALAAKHNELFVSGRLATISELKIKGKILIVIKPTTYMNLSGRAVKYWMDKEKIDISNVLVIVDEIALPLSKLRLRGSGSAAGHNGLKSIEETLMSNQYPRLRFGIGNDYPKGAQVDYVLGEWEESELPLVRLKIEGSVKAVEDFVTKGINLTMNEVNNLEFRL
jgi:peptidyl-tRNA hydrolase, PTH1 family